MLAAEQQTNSGSNPDRAPDRSLFKRVQTDIEAHPVSYSNGTEGSFSWSKAAGA
jgi:hypothetical protein